MKKLKTILQHRKTYIYLIISTVLLSIPRLFITSESTYNSKDKRIIGLIYDIEFYDDYCTLKIKAKEDLIGTYYYNDDKEKIINDFEIGNKIMFFGELEQPSNNTIPNMFNYKKYLYNKKIFYYIRINEYALIHKNQNVFYKIKNRINISLKENNKTNLYLKLFIVGSNNLDDKTKEIYSNMGIIHLMSISGMHIGVFIGTIKKTLKKLKINKYISFIITTCILLFYMFIVGYSESIKKSGLFFLIKYLSEIFDLSITNMRVLILCSVILIAINPYIIFNTGFLFSFVVTLYLISFTPLINKNKNAISSLFMASFVAWLSSIPICIYNNYSINLLSVFYNMICIPLVSYIIFPLAILTFLIRKFSSIFLLSISLFEKIASISSKINSTIILGRANIVVLLLYYIIMTFVLIKVKNNKKNWLVVFAVFLLLHNNYNRFIKKQYVLMYDVGQGDSVLIHKGNKNILIDIGGNRNKPNNYSKLVKSFKSNGIKKIDYLIITHGDYDHMGEAINLVNNFKVENVIFNCGEFNDLEKELISVLNKKKIKYYSCIKELNFDNNKLYFLNNTDYGNENDNSIVLYTELNNKKFLFMGDASVKTEKDIMNKYNLEDIDAIKVGHHGSKTSSSEEFIDMVNPKYSVISVGKNNRYGHPNNEVLGILDKSKIYRTDQDGSVMFELKNNKLNVSTCPP